MKLSVNILNWNCLDVLQDTIHLLNEELVWIDHEIIIVDNGSNAENKDYLFDLDNKQSNVRIFSLNENKGISIGKNIGIEHSKGKYILLLDADVYPVRNSINMLMEHLDKTEDCHAIGFYPNKWSNQKNTETIKYHEDYCYEIFEPKIHTCPCLFYGIYRKKLFDDGLRMCEEGAYGEEGYGWEDHDFYMRLKEMGYEQWVAHMNSPKGKYFHAINSSINNEGCMGRAKYMETSRERAKLFKSRWH